ncbi:MAG: O-antigen ligase family protein [Candidatus Melainabacteria bacterium]|nr:O-antigen ligase family protein [Candidatus Melainabacteria bacterium]
MHRSSVTHFFGTHGRASLFQRMNTPLLFGLTAIGGVLLPLLLYGLLPALGVEAPAGWLSVDRLVLLVLGLLGLLTYGVLFRYVWQQPVSLLYWLVLLWVPVEYGRTFLLNNVGVNLDYRVLMLLFLPPVALALGGRYAATLLKRCAYLLPLGAFVLLTAWYFVFFNINMVNPIQALGNSSFGGSIALNFASAMVYSWVGAMVGILALRGSDRPVETFHRFNRWLVVGVLLESVLSIVAYPAFVMNIDGFQRLAGILPHPNMWVHHLGLLLLYLTGLFLYNHCQENPPGQLQAPSTQPTGWLLLALLAGSVSFLLGLSKTGIALLAVSLLLLLGLSMLVVPSIRRRGWSVLLLLGLLIPVGWVAYPILTGESLLKMLEARLEDTSSMEWRMNLWQNLLANLDASSFLWGKGLTACNEWIFQLTYDNGNSFKPLILPHNGYLQLLYDFGLLGLLYFAAIGVLVWQTAQRGIFSAKQPPAERILAVTLVAMVVYFLGVLAFDEMLVMFNAPFLFWTLSSLLFARLLCPKPPQRHPYPSASSSSSLNLYSSVHATSGAPSHTNPMRGILQ